MKLNHECVRAMLLDFESELEFNDSMFQDAMKELPSYKKYGHDDFWYCFQKLISVNYINAYVQGGDDEYPYAANISSLTWEGHEFLDTVRDNAVWKETKSILSKVSSSSLSFMSTVASQVLTNIISKQMGLS
ncbi:DUF2513 domain-containing protein [Lacticaseibacillus saniviri]